MKTISLIIGLFLLIMSPVKAQDSDPFHSLMHNLASIDLTHLMPLKQDQPPQEDYATLEARTFARMNWGPEEIDWFRNVYTPLYGNPEQYIRDIAAAYDQLDAAETQP